MAKYYMDVKGNVTVKSAVAQKKKAPKFTMDENGNVIVNTDQDEDIAPVRASVSKDPQYDRKAREGLSAYEKKKQEEREAEANKNWFQRWMELNANAYAAQSDNPLVQSFNTLSQQYRQDTSYKEIGSSWSEDQKKRFGYLYQQNPTFAAQYAESVNNEINKAKADAERGKVMGKAADRGIIGNTALALLQGMTATGDLLDNMAEFAGRGTITQKAGLTIYDRSQANIAGYSEKLNKLGTIDKDVAILGGKGLGDLYSLGYSAAQSLLYGATGNGALVMTQFFAQAAASGIDEKMEQGATAQQAMLYGMASGAAEAIAEKIGIDNLFKNVGAKTWSAALKNMLKQGAAEGMEEALTSVLNTFSDQAIMGKESQYHRAVAEYSKNMSQEEAKRKAFWDIMEGIAYDALGGMVTGSGNTMVMTGANAAKNLAQGKDALSGLTANEKKVVDSYYKALVAEEAKNSKNGKVSMDRKNELFEEAIKAMDEGSISIETIEEALGGENFQAYQDAVSNEKAWQEEFDQLNGMKEMEMTGVQKDRKTELRQKLDTYKSGNTQAVLKDKLSKGVAELARVSRLSESYRERDRRSQAFQADVKEYSGKAQQIVQKAIDSGILNNTRRSHQLVDLIAKVGSDKNLDFDFANNDKLKESGFALEGKIVNGVVTGNGVTVNINSAKALNTVVGHEITHVLEGSEFYDALSGAAIEMAKAKGEYDSRMKDIEALYTEDLDGYGGEGRAAALEKELVADLVGDYLFTDSAFIDRLYTGNRNAFEKIFDEVKYFCRMATAGSKEAKQLEKVKKAFEDAYRQKTRPISDEQNEKGLNAKEEVDFSLSNDAAYMQKAIETNELALTIDRNVMNAAKETRARIAERMNAIKDKGNVGMPEDIEGNTYIANSSYDGTEENTTICPRSLASEAFTDAVAEYLGRPLSLEEQIYISQDLQGRSITPECTYCYVATDRKAYRAFLGEYIDQRDAVLKDYKTGNWDTKTYSAAQISKMSAEQKEKSLYVKFLNGRKPTTNMANRFSMWIKAAQNGTPMVEASHLANINKLMGDINSEFGAELKPQIVDAMKYAQSASWAKKRISYVAYNGHILKWKQDRINKLNSHYGLRMYSFSDFHPAFVLENMQMITDASVRGLKMLAYTKDTDFVDIFAPTGMNINVSTFGFAAGDNVYENNLIGAEWEKAKALREKYPNVGITFVATNDKIVEWALKQDWIDVVIPYHLVRTGTEVAKAFGYTNYTSESADSKEADWKKGADKKSISPTEHNNDKATYLEALAKNHLKPRFARFLNDPNYMKLVNECRQPASESKPVQPIFNEGAAMEALAKLEANGYYQPIGGSVDRMYEIAAEVAENMQNEKKTTDSYSLSSQEDLAPVRKDLRSGRIYGSDVELAPVRQDVQAQAETEERGEYDDLPFEMPEGIEQGQMTDEELEEDAKRRPVETVTQRLEVKFASLRQELRENEQHRQVSNDAYERKIEELQQRYDAKPNKHTKAANAILRQISKQKQLQAQRDAEFEKRIHDIQKKIDNTRELIKWDHSREDLLEKQLRQVDEKLETDKQALEEEFQARRADAEKLADKNTYISSEARKLYDEIINHKKGTRFSNEIGELLDKGHSFQQIKTALLLIEEKPEGRKGSSWVVEKDLREILGRNYENAVYEADEIDSEYQKRLDALEAQAKEDRASYTTAAQRKNIQLQYEQQMEKLAGDTSKWKDKALGVQYQINTLRRNLRDVVRDENGKPDIARADAIWDALQGSYNHNEAQLKRESARIKGDYAALRLTKEENVYVQMLGEFRHNPETTLSLETVEGYLEEHKDKIDTEKVDKAIEMARQTYDELLVRVNAALRKQGMKEIPYRKGYFPHFTEEAKGRGRLFLEKVLNFKYKSDDIPTDIAGLTEGFNPNRSWQSFNKERTSDITEYNFAKGMDSYVHGALDWIYHMEDIQKRRAFENHIRYVHSDEGVQARIDEVKKNDMLDADQVQEEIDKILAEKKNPLNNLVNDLRTGTNILAGKKNSMDRGMEQATNRKVYSIMTSLSSRINANMVAGSVSSALTNFIPITQSWGEVNPLSTLQAMGETIKSYVRDDDVVNKSDFLTNRLRPEENLYKTGWDKVSDHVGWMMEAVDNFSAQTIWRSKYNENVSKGMSEAEAIKNADEFAEGVMAGRSRGNMPTMFDAKNPVARVLTAFQLEVNNQYGYMFKDMPQNMQKETKTKLVAGYAKMFLGAYAYNALFSQLTGRDSAFDPIRIVQELLGDLFPDDDEEEKKASEIIAGVAENVAQEAPFIGGLLGGGRIPISSALPYGEGLVEMVTNTAKDIENKNFANLTWEWLNPAFYLLTPVGGGQMRKSAMGLSMFLNDKPTPGSYTATGNLRFPVEPTIGNIAQGMVFGQWANKNARSYIEEGRTPIQANQIQDFLNSGLTYEGWWKQKDALKKAENDFNAQEPIAAFRAAQEQLEDLAADALAGDQEILQEKFIQSAAKDLSEIKKEMMELVTMPLNEAAKTKQMQLLQEKANSIAKEAVNAYSNVEIENGYATVGEKVWKQGTDGEWKRLTGDQLAKYQATIGAGAEGYATDGSNHYVESKDGWRKLTDDQVSKQRAVTGALGITAQDYWGEKHEEYDFAYENPEMYTIAKAVGGYDTYSQWKKAMGNIQGDQKNGKTVPGSKKEKIWDYIDQQKMTDGQKYLLFKSMYPADDTYNKEIVKYLNSRRDITFADKKKMLEKLGFTVNKDGTIDW